MASGLTLAELQTLKTNLLAAHAKALRAEETDITGTRIKRSKSAEIWQQIKDVGTEIAALQATSSSATSNAAPDIGRVRFGRR